MAQHLKVVLHHFLSYLSQFKMGKEHKLQQPQLKQTFFHFCGKSDFLRFTNKEGCLYSSTQRFTSQGNKMTTELLHI